MTIGDLRRGKPLCLLAVAVAVGATLASGIVARYYADRARDAKIEADVAWDSATMLLTEMTERAERIPFIIDSISAHWQHVMDTLTLVPQELPPTSEGVTATLDTAQMNEGLRAAVDTIMAENVTLRAQADTLRRTVTNLRAAAMVMADSINAFWSEQQARDMEVILALREAVVASRREADQWETAYYASRMSWSDRLVWSVGGAVVGYLGNDVISNLGGAQ